MTIPAAKKFHIKEIKMEHIGHEIQIMNGSRQAILEIKMDTHQSVSQLHGTKLSHKRARRDGLTVKKDLTRSLESRNL